MDTNPVGETRRAEEVDYERLKKAGVIANRYTNDCTIGCIKCQVKRPLAMVAHRVGDLVVGFVYVCPACFDDVAGKGLEVVGMAKDAITRLPQAHGIYEEQTPSH